jgi:hypothetical protein
MLEMRAAGRELLDGRKCALSCPRVTRHLDAALDRIFGREEAAAGCQERLHEPGVDPVADQAEETKLAARRVDFRGDLVTPWIAHIKERQVNHW